MGSSRTKPIWLLAAELRLHTQQMHDKVLVGLRALGVTSFQTAEPGEITSYVKAQTLFDTLGAEGVLVDVAADLAARVRQLQPGPRCVTAPFVAPSDMSAVCRSENLILRGSMFTMFDMVKVEFEVLCATGTDAKPEDAGRRATLSPRELAKLLE